MAVNTKSVLSHSAQATHKLGYSVGKHAHRGSIYLLDGGLGIGKSVFAAGVAEALGIPGPIMSPTFTIVAEYVTDSEHGEVPFFHVDLYRIQSQGEFELLGLEDVLDGACVCVIEWPDRAGTALPETASCIRFELLTDGTRRITYPTGLLLDLNGIGIEA